MNLALFDLDNTLLAGDSDFEWAQFLVHKGVLDRATHEQRNLQFFQAYTAGTLNIDEFLEFQLAPLARVKRATLNEWHQEYMRDRVQPMITARARTLIADHQTDLCAVVTATNDFVTAPIARELGIEHLIATQADQVAGEFTGRVRGTPSFREGKVTRVNQWLRERKRELKDFDKTYFYSDSLNDLPLLSVVNQPVAVDPDATLRAHAEKHGWPVISLR
jgi:HAD superfamily hydrolase (TIGR01490 family)